MEMESVFKFIIKTAEPVGTGTAVFCVREMKDKYLVIYDLVIYD